MYRLPGIPLPGPALTRVCRADSRRRVLLDGASDSTRGPEAAARPIRHGTGHCCLPAYQRISACPAGLRAPIVAGAQP